MLILCLKYDIIIVDLINHQIGLTTETLDVTVFSKIDNCTLFYKNVKKIIIIWCSCCLLSLHII